MTDPVRTEIHVDIPPGKAFARFVDDLGRWWPVAYSWSGAKFRQARIEPKVGGFWGETDDEGFDWSWGEVRAYEPGMRIVVSFNISAERQPEPPERQSEVEIAFESDGDGTRIHLEHRELDRHGEGAALIAQGMSAQGWPSILAEFAREVRRPR